MLLLSVGFRFDLYTVKQLEITENKLIEALCEHELQ